MQEVYNQLEKEIHLKAGDTVVLGVSSGPDSMALLYFMLMIRKSIPISLVVAHVNHNVRRESAKEAKFLEEYCAKYDVTFEKMKIEQYSDDNFHNEARNIRYHFFENLVHKYHASYLMTAHHADDLIETVLMRITRGSTLKGYSGFQKIVDFDDYKIVRPFITLTKEEIMAFLKKHRVPYMIDKSNFKDKYTRNRYRRYVLPFLKKEDKEVHRKFYQFSETLLEYNQFLDAQVDKVYHKTYQDRTLFLSSFLELHPLIQEKILFRILEEIYPDDLMVIHRKHIELMMSLMTSKKKNSYIYLPDNIKVVKEYDTVKIKDQVLSIDSYEMELGNYVLLPNKHHIEKVTSCDTNGNDICRLSSDEVELPLYVRTRKHGDKIALFGKSGHKKVKDIFIDCKIPLEMRELWPVVIDSRGEIIWIPGIKKSKFMKKKSDKYDIIYKYN